MLRVNHLSGFGRIVPAAGGGGDYAPVTWTDKVNVTESPTGTLTKDAIGEGWNAGAFSVEGFAGNGSVRWTIDDDTHLLGIGLSQTNTDANFNTIDYAFVLVGDTLLRVYEDGVNRGTVDDPANGDVLEIIRTGTAIDFQINGVSVYSSGVSSSGTLYVDCSLYSGSTPRAVLNGVEIGT